MSESNLDYEGRRAAPVGEPEGGNPIAAALCVVGAGLIGVAGALLIGLGEVAAAMRGSAGSFESGVGIAMIAVAGVVLVIALVQWIRTG